MNYFEQEPKALGPYLYIYLLIFTTLQVPSFVRKSQPELLLTGQEKSMENGGVQ